MNYFAAKIPADNSDKFLGDKFMKLYICIDDTDNLDSKGTGTIADELCRIIEKDFGGTYTFVSRHQLLIHESIRYTSHNSSMCFTCEINDSDYEAVKTACLNHVKEESAEGSDPGVAIANPDTMDKDALITYGKECKRKVMTKEIAYDTAKKSNVFLTELGGTGIGIIGALAGIGLRAWGNDGTLKGKLNQLSEDDYTKVSEIMKSKYVCHVFDENGNQLPDDDLVFVKGKSKPALVNGELTLLTKAEKDKDGHIIPGKHVMLGKESIKNYGAQMIFREGCAEFSYDVPEEQIDSSRSCFNCRYRRWMENNLIMCAKGRL